MTEAVDAPENTNDDVWFPCRVDSGVTALKVAGRSSGENSGGTVRTEIGEGHRTDVQSGYSENSRHRLQTRYKVSCLWT